MSIFWNSFFGLDSNINQIDGDDIHSDKNTTEEISSASFDGHLVDAEFDDLLANYKDEINQETLILAYRNDVRVVINVAYIILVVISLVGNTLVCVVMTRSSKIRNVTNFFLANQAFSDIIMTLFNIPLVLTRNLSDAWPYGRFMCYITDYIIQVSTFVSSLTLTAIAVDRHQVIVHPLRPRMDVNSAFVISCIIWWFSLILSLPNAVFRRLHQWETLLQSGYKCIASYPDPSDLYRRIFVLSSIILRYVIPLIIIITMNRLIALALRGRMTIEHLTASQQTIKDKCHRRTTTMLILVVVVFGVTWFPLNVYVILVLFYESLHDNAMYLILYYFAMIGITVNPFLYCWLNAKFRSELKSMFRTKEAPKAVTSNVKESSGVNSSKSKGNGTNAAQSNHGPIYV
ncbi:G-protein coupled receptor 83-like [Antedon mediterranea]|uniref:G-protein coupled receptor 83-like n=1 Tax=Antedon mediterranea TaxID=105859 RepID=UPI003AF433CF